MGIADQPEGKLSPGEKFLEDPLGTEEGNNGFLGVTGKLEGSQSIPHPISDLLMKISLPPAIAGKLGERAKYLQEGVEDKSKVEFFGKAASREMGVVKGSGTI